MRRPSSRTIKFILQKITKIANNEVKIKYIKPSIGELQQRIASSLQSRAIKFLMYLWDTDLQ